MYVDNDYEYIYMIHCGDETAFSMLLKKYDEALHFIIYKYQKRKDRVWNEDDFMQLARTKLLLAVNNYREDIEASFAGYYFEIFQHAMIDFYRLRFTYKGACEYACVPIDYCIKDISAQYYDTIAKDSADDDVMDRIETLKKKLNPMEQKIVDLRVQGYQYAQIGEILSINKRKVDNTLRKLKKRNKQ